MIPALVIAAGVTFGYMLRCLRSRDHEMAPAREARILAERQETQLVHQTETYLKEMHS